MLRNLISAITNFLAAVTRTEIIIPDVSFWQDRNDTPRKIDFVRMRTKSRGVIIRGGQNTWDDDDFGYNWPAAYFAKLLRGIYWFWDSRSSPKSQALRLYNLVKNDPPEMEVWFDFEETYGGRYGGWRNFAAMIGEFQQLMPSAGVGIYVGYYYWLENGPNPDKETTSKGKAEARAALEWFAKFPLWLPWYTSNLLTVKIPRPWKKALYWQYIAKSNVGLEYGAESLDIDLNYFQGTVAEFDERYGAETIVVVPPPPPPVVAKYFGVVKVAKVNVRALRSAGADDVGDLFRGTEVFGDEITTIAGYDWLRLVAGPGYPEKYVGMYTACGPANDPRAYISITQK